MNQPLAYVHPGAKIAKNVVIEPFTTIHNDVVIGEGSWICADAFIGPDVFIGKEAVVGARCVVMKNVKSNTVVFGNPARKIGQRWQSDRFLSHYSEKLSDEQK